MRPQAQSGGDPEGGEGERSGTGEVGKPQDPGDEQRGEPCDEQRGDGGEDRAAHVDDPGGAGGRGALLAVPPAAEERDRLEAYVKPDELQEIRQRIAKEAA